ncbi:MULTISPECIES: hypothetical protein [Microbulbifer]|uniref:hypothetical protein n=1 Tax=Microbulbifer TaxID=48073 RepID=UPI001E512B2F|nr:MULTISPECIES: hypothetical protein [Microbulbifer]UHQ55355.1 hypothetical protein LVE68_17890 [Microbulbifer sp. YPW16]
MSNPTLTVAAHVVDSAQGRAAAFVPVNLRATSTNMPLSVQADVPAFPGTSPALTVTGTWTVAGSRVTASGIPLVNTQSVGVGYTPVPASSGPLQILPGNQHVLITF